MCCGKAAILNKSFLKLKLTHYRSAFFVFINLNFC